MTSDVVYTKRKYAKCVEIALKGVERLLECPDYARLDPSKDQQSLINWLMHEVKNAKAMWGPLNLYVQIYKKKHRLPKIYEIVRDLEKGKITRRDAENLLDKVIEMYEMGVLLLDYTWSPEKSMYVKINPVSPDKKPNGILRKLLKKE